MIRSKGVKGYSISGGGLISSLHSTTAASATASPTTPQLPPAVVSLNGQSSQAIPATSTSTSNDGTRRRERAASIDSDAIDDDTEVQHPAELAPKKRKLAPALPNEKASTAGGKGKPRAKGKGKGKANEPAFVSALPWPKHFVELDKVFKALNTVYTFCSSRKSMVTTFETLKGGVENLLKRPLEIGDIAQIKSLLPSVITFAYIDSELLRVHSSGADPEKEKREKKRKELDDAYELAGTASTKQPPQKDGKDIVLLLSFNDGELKTTDRSDKLPSRKSRKKASADGTPLAAAPSTPTPVYTTATITSLVQRRNLKFTQAISELLVACEAHQPPQDPIALLLAATEDNLPVDPRGEDKGKGRKKKKDDVEFWMRNPDKRLSIEDILDEIKEAEDYQDQIVDGGHRIFDAREAVYKEYPYISPQIQDALLSSPGSISSLYSHQSLALSHLDKGKSVIVATSTSSGKSLIYQIPMLKALENDPQATGLYIFPTKALAQDQMRALGAVLGRCEELEDVKIATFDGDTKKEDRDFIRENASVIFTNPDMLHVTVLPREESWRRFFRNLKFVVVDELHVYAGLFGSHVAFVMRRLRRICAALGNPGVQFISCSATIANPVEHMKTIFGIDDVELVEEDGSPTGRKEYIVWNPPFIDDRDPKQGRVSTVTETSRIFRFLMDRGLRVIVFCRVRMQCEILMKQVRADLMLEGRDDVASRVMAYRSGYSAADRRKIEQEMFSGELLGVIATTALELGIDIGSLDAVLSVGFPYTLPGLRQQAGRAGRRNKDSLAMLICDPFPVDQHYAAHPDEIFASPYNELSIDLNNPIVLEAHLQCAADELPLHPVDDLIYFGSSLPELCASRLIGDSEGFYHCHPRYKPNPARTVPIRNTEDETYTIVDVTDGRNEVLEEVEFSRAIFTVYEGAVFMHQGRTFLVTEVGHDQRLAKVERSVINWRTRQRDFTNVDPLETLSIREIKGSECTAAYGTVQITSVVFGYFKTDHRNNILDSVDISSPPFIRSSHGFWIDVPRSALEILLLKNLHPAASIHAAEHALMSLTPIVAMCLEGDIRTECKQPEKELASRPSSRKRPARLILYDTSGKSGGVCAKAFDHITMLLTRAADTIANCRCSDGCPSCVASSMCSGANTIVSKLGALVVLDSILGRDIDLDSIPLQPLAFGVVPGGSIDLAGAGIRRQAVTDRVNVADQGPDSDEEAEREAALAQLMSGEDLVGDGAVFRLADGGGFVRGA